MSSIYRDTAGWRVAWMEHGRRRFKRFASPKDAKRFAAELEMGTADKSPARVSSPTFEVFAARYMREHCEVRKAPTQVDSEGRNIRLHLLPLIGQVRLLELRRAHLLAVQAELVRKTAHGKRRVLSPTTVNLVTTLAKTMLQVAADWDLVPASPFRGVKLLHKVERRPTFWTPEERDAFIAKAMALDPMFVRAVTVACHTGLRLGELAALTAADVDFDNETIDVTKSLDTQTGLLGPTKNKEAASVPLNRAAKGALEHVRFLQGDAPVFDRALFWSPRKRLGRLAKRVGVPPIRFHDLRHTFASCLARAGVDLLRIQRLCRHKSYAMTLRYAHLHPDHLKGATDVLCANSAPLNSVRSKSGDLGGT